MGKPKFFRDPVHLQIRFDAVDLSSEPPKDFRALSWALQTLIDTPTFRRLRFIRQNGLANLVFHGAEHSRFIHSLGVSYVARTMYERICRNMSEEESEELKLRTTIAALVHDVGHGPFSHSFEEILAENGIPFKHEAMSIRLIEEDDSSICKVLKQIDPALPGLIVPFFDKKQRVQDHWTYRIVASQLDADRLDYVQRDALFAGLKGHGFDFERLLDLIHHHENKIAVDRGATEAVESYLVALDQLYRAIYYHHAVRAGTQMLKSLFRRAIFLSKNGDRAIFPTLSNGDPNPLSVLIEVGAKTPLHHYEGLTEYKMWSHVDDWKSHADPLLSELASRLLSRNLFKAIEVDPSDFKKTQKLEQDAKEAVKEIYRGIADVEEYFVVFDDPTRTSYKRYDWRPESEDESIWLVGRGKPPLPLEDENESTIIQSFKEKRYFPRLIVPGSVREKLM